MIVYKAVNKISGKGGKLLLIRLIRMRSVFQRKIKQSIQLGYYTYGRPAIEYNYPKWYKTEVIE